MTQWVNLPVVTSKWSAGSSSVWAVLLIQLAAGVPGKAVDGDPPLLPMWEFQMVPGSWSQPGSDLVVWLLG